MTKEEILQYKRRYKNYDFKNKKADEDIILVVRQHWLVFLYEFLPYIIALIFLVVVHFVLQEYGFVFFPAFNSDLAIFLELVVGIVLWVLFFISWVDFYFDVWIVTTHRVVDIEQLGLFNRNVSELEHSKVQDVTTEIHGFLPTLLNFGYVYIQTAGKKGRFIFKNVPHPDKIRKLIVELQKREDLRR